MITHSDHWADKDHIYLLCASYSILFMSGSQSEANDENERKPFLKEFLC